MTANRVLIFGPRIAPLSIIGDPDAISIAVEIDREYRLTTTMGGMIRPTADFGDGDQSFRRT